MDGDVGGTVGEKGGNDPDIIDGKSIGLEFEEQTGMPHTVIGTLQVQGHKDGRSTGVKLAGEEVSEAEELVIRREGRTKATLGVREEVVEGKVVMDTAGKDGFKDLAEDWSEADGAIGRSFGGGLVRLREH